MMTQSTENGPSMTTPLSQSTSMAVDLSSRPVADHSTPMTVRMAFSGNATEYFKIWLTNLALTIITLTLYTPWAKVRRLRYFYGNTSVLDHHFDFTGVPTRILIGRLIALGIYGLISVASQIDSEYQIGLVLVMLAIVPWLIRSSLRFTARNSKFGNIRFHFSGSMVRTYGVLVGCTLVTLLSLGILYPLALYWYKRYQFNHLSLGQLPLRLSVDFGEVFAAILLPMMFFIGMLVVAVGLAVGLVAGGAVSEQSPLAVGGFVLAALAYIIGLLYLRPLIAGYLFRAIWSHVHIGNNQMHTDCNPWRYGWIEMSNAFAIVFSLGLLYPWAVIRTHRYKVESLLLTCVDDPEQLYNLAQSDPYAIGEELADLFDIDVSL